MALMHFLIYCMIVMDILAPHLDSIWINDYFYLLGCLDMSFFKNKLKDSDKDKNFGSSCQLYFCSQIVRFMWNISIFDCKNRYISFKITLYYGCPNLVVLFHKC